MVYSSLAALLPGEGIRGITGLLVGTVLLAAILQTLFRLYGMIKKRRREDEALKDFPGPPRHWLWGNLRDVKGPGEICQKTVEYTIRYGPLRRLRLGPVESYVLLVAADYVQCLLNTGEPKEPQMYGFLEPWIGDGLLLSKGKKWARNRRLLTPAFHFDVLKPYAGIFSSSSIIMKEKWEKMLKSSNRIEMFESVSLMTLDSLLKCAFTYPSNCQTEGRKNPYIQAVYLLSELITKRFRNPLHHSPFFYYFSWNGYKFRQACNMVHNYSKEVIHARRTESGNVTKRKYLDFLDILLDARDEAGNGLTDEEIQHEVDTFMFEGHDTTASGLSWFFYNMATHPEEQQRCRDEVLSVIGDRDEITWDELPNLDYLTMCIKESLRIHPPVPNISRQITKPITFPNGLTAPAGMWVGVGIYALHHNPEVWEDPEKFDPMRFSPENSKGRSPHAFTPFSAGPRNCIGQHFAMNEMKICASLILKHFELSFGENEDPIKYPELILRAKKGLWLTVKPIS